MLFNSLAFIVFLTIVLIIYPRLQHKGQNLFLLAASYTFYGYWDWRFNFLLLSSTIVNFILGKNIHNSEKPKQRKRQLAISVSFNVGILCFFKYFNFFIDSFASMMAGVGLNSNLPLIQVVLPVGISFYTFQTMSYTIDIYQRRLSPTENFFDFALFVSFFPQLVAGPIERAKNLLPQIRFARLVAGRGWAYEGCIVLGTAPDVKWLAVV